MCHYLCYLGPEKLKRAIWCELFVIRDGYIPYLKKWNKASAVGSREDIVHSDIQRLALGVSMERSSGSLEVTKLLAKDACQKSGLASHQEQLTRRRSDDPPHWCSPESEIDIYQH